MPLGASTRQRQAVRRIYLLPAAQTKDKHAVAPEDVKEIVSGLKKDFDYVVIDCPAGIEQGFKNAVAGADKAIVVTTPENAAVRDADRIIGLLESEKIFEPKLIINRARVNMMKKGDMLDIDEICSVLGDRFARASFQMMNPLSKRRTPGNLQS